MKKIGGKRMPLVTTKNMFEKSIKENFAVGAFNINNMEIIQGIVDAYKEANPISDSGFKKVDEVLDILKKKI